MKRIPMIASKVLTYGTRRLRAGDTFEATPQHARVLTAVGLARETARISVPAPKPVSKPAPVRPPLPPIVETELSQLRYDYEVKTGSKADMRWGVARLRAEIEALQ
jgi:hypothetical protein